VNKTLVRAKRLSQSNAFSQPKPMSLWGESPHTPRRMLSKVDALIVVSRYVAKLKLYIRLEPMFFAKLITDGVALKFDFSGGLCPPNPPTLLPAAALDRLCIGLSLQSSFLAVCCKMLLNGPWVRKRENGLKRENKVNRWGALPPTPPSLAGFARS